MTEAEVRGALWVLGVRDPQVEYWDYGRVLSASTPIKEDRVGRQVKLMRGGKPSREEVGILAQELIRVGSSDITTHTHKQD